MHGIYPNLREQWTKQNALFTSPVINKKRRIMERFNNITWGKGENRRNTKESFILKSDKLFAILHEFIH